jgi:hypothetical protein
LIPTNELWSLDLHGPPTWRAVTDTVGTAPVMMAPVGAYDATRHRLVVAGWIPCGTGCTPHRQLWELRLDGTHAWRRLDFTGPEDLLPDYRAAYDPVRNRLIDVQGMSEPAVLRTLSLSDYHVEAIVPRGTPPARRGRTSIALDSANDRLVMYGGSGFTEWLDDLWSVPFAGCPPGRRGPRRSGSPTVAKANSAGLSIARWSLAVAGGRVSASIHFASADPATIELIDIAGRRLIHERAIPAKSGAYAWAARGENALPPGIFFLRVTQSGASAVAKTVVLR